MPCPNINDIVISGDWKIDLNQGQWERVYHSLSKSCKKPGAMSTAVAEALAEMSRRIQQIEAKRVLKNRSERSHLASESQPIQDVIDAVLFKCYGLSEDEANYVTGRLKEML